jgi:hypothetical protein
MLWVGKNCAQSFLCNSTVYVKTFTSVIIEDLRDISNVAKTWISHFEVRNQRYKFLPKRKCLIAVALPNEKNLMVFVCVYVCVCVCVCVCLHIESCCVKQDSLVYDLMNLSDPPVSASQVLGATRACHHAWLILYFNVILFFFSLCLSLRQHHHV